MRCNQCGTENPDGMKFCGNCGQPLARACPQCGQPNPAGFKFCGNCGSPLGQPAPPAATPPPPAASQPAPSPPPAPAAPPAPEPPAPAPARESERRTVTVLFADVSGSTAMAEKLDPEEFTGIMNDCFRRLTARITRYEGTIDKYIGDAVMALFGAPVAHENDPERAILAALEMQETLRDFSARLVRRYGMPLAMRIGINSGEVIAGQVGGEGKTDYTVMGDAVNVASRLEHACPIGQVLVSQSVYASTRGMFEFETLDPIRVKGKSEPLQVYVPLRAATRRRGIRGLGEGATPFVGRQTELDALKAAYRRTIAGEPQLVALVGEGGLGKSRLRVELHGWIEREGQLRRARTALGRCLPYSKGNTYGLIVSLLRSFFGIPEGETEEAVAERLEERLVDPDLARPLVPLLTGGISRLSTLYSSPEEWRRQALAALCAIISDEAELAPLIIYLEDLHWIDRSSAELLDQVIRSTRHGRVFFLLMYRPDFAEGPALRTHPGFRRLDLQPLTADEAAELIEGTLVHVDFPAGLRRRIVERSGGNPFYVEEIVKTYIDRGLITLEDGVWRAGPTIEQEPLPDTVQAIIMTRIDRLDEDPRRLLQQAAVLGRRFVRRLIEAVSDVRSLDPTMERLEDQDFIHPGGGHGGQAEYVFKHALMQEVAYNALLVRRRKEIHQQAGEAIERLSGDALDQVLDLLALHFSRAEAWEKTLTYCQRAGDRARALYANDEALHYYQLCLTAIDRLAEATAATEDAEDEDAWLQPAGGRVTPDDLAAIRVDVQMGLSDVLALTGQYDQALASYQAAFDGARERARRAEILWRLADSIYERRSQYDQALGCLDRAAAELGGRRASVVLAKVRTSIAKIAMRQGRLDDALRVVEESVELLTGSTYQRELSRALRQLGNIHYATGDFAGAMANWQQALDVARQTGDPRESAPIVNNMGIISFHRGDCPAAMSHFQEYLRLAEQIGDPHLIAQAHAHLGICHRHEGETASAVDAYRHSLAINERIGDLRGQVQGYTNLGEALRDAGRLPDAQELLERARRLAGEIGGKSLLPEIEHQRAETLLALGDVQQAIAVVEAGLLAATAGGDRFAEGTLYRTLGIARARLGAHADADEAFVRSLEVLGKMGADQEQATTRLERAAALLTAGRPDSAQPDLDQATAAIARIGTARQRARLAELREALAQVASPR